MPPKPLLIPDYNSQTRLEDGSKSNATYVLRPLEMLKPSLMMPERMVFFTDRDDWVSGMRKSDDEGFLATSCAVGIYGNQPIPLVFAYSNAAYFTNLSQTVQLRVGPITVVGTHRHLETMNANGAFGNLIRMLGYQPSPGYLSVLADVDYSSTSIDDASWELACFCALAGFDPVFVTGSVLNPSWTATGLDIKARLPLSRGMPLYAYQLGPQAGAMSLSPFGVRIPNGNGIPGVFNVGSFVGLMQTVLIDVSGFKKELGAKGKIAQVELDRKEQNYAQNPGLMQREFKDMLQRQAKNTIDAVKAWSDEKKAAFHREFRAAEDIPYSTEALEDGTLDAFLVGLLDEPGEVDKAKWKVFVTSMRANPGPKTSLLAAWARPLSMERSANLVVTLIQQYVSTIVDPVKVGSVPKPKELFLAPSNAARLRELMGRRKRPELNAD